MPIAFPDLPLSSLLYLKTINAAVFYEIGAAAATATYSYGIGIDHGHHFFRLTYPIRLGIRTGYETQHKKDVRRPDFLIGLRVR